MVQLNVVSLIQKYTKFANSTRLYFPHFTIFETKLNNVTNLIKDDLSKYANKFSDLKICLLGERSIV